MGTSSSSTGSGSNSPLVPPWAADLDGQGAGPQPQGNRFKPFRTSLGKHVSGQGGNHLQKALGHFSRTAVGGGGVGSRRFAPMAAGGAGLIALLGDLQAGGNGSAIVGVDVSHCIGESAEYAVQEFVRALSPDNADAAIIEAALECALLDVLDENNDFDPSVITENDLLNIFSSYLSEAVFNWIVFESDKAFQKTDNAANAVKKENELRETVKAAVDLAISDKSINSVSNLSTQSVAQLQKEIVKDVLDVWEGYLD